jgi:hypothetical protein
MDSQSALDQTAIFDSALTRTAGGAVGATIDQLDDLSLSEVSGFKEPLVQRSDSRVILGLFVLPGSNTLVRGRGLGTSAIGARDPSGRARQVRV